MKPSILSTILFFAVTSGVSAFNPIINSTSIPYDVTVIDRKISLQSEYLGELVGYPQVYEFRLNQDEELTLNLWQRNTENPISLSMIVVKENNEDSGVTEIGRLKASDLGWEVIKNNILGMDLLRSDTFSAAIKPGVYRIEISAPDNFGKYMLTFGNFDTQLGYFKTVAGIRDIQAFFGYSIFKMIGSTFVFYPLGIILVILLLYLSRRYQSRIKTKFKSFK